MGGCSGFVCYMNILTYLKLSLREGIQVGICDGAELEQASYQVEGTKCQYRYSEGVHDMYERLDKRYGKRNLQREESYHDMDELELRQRLLNQRMSSDRIMERVSNGKRKLQREEMYHDLDELDLRHRLLKQRKINGRQSTFSPDHCVKLDWRHNYFVDEETYRAHHVCKGSERFFMESSICSHLQGRITLPARSSPNQPIDLQSKRNKDKGCHQERSSTARPVNYKGKKYDKLKRRSIFSNVRNAGIQPIRREEADLLNFAGPKSLAELKGAKLSENLLGQKKIKIRKSLGLQGSKGFLSFEGPKPLQVILNRKRENAYGNGANCCNGDKSTQRDNVGGIGSFVSSITQREDNYTTNHYKDSKVAGIGEEKVGTIPMEGEKLPNDDQTSSGGNTHEVEDGMIVGAIDDQELENYGPRAGESAFEEIEHEEFEREDDYSYHEDEEDDEDDFAKKLAALMCS